MGKEENTSGLPVEYLIEVISSVKSALINIDRNSTQNQQILDELSESIKLLTELYKKLSQDQKGNQEKLDKTISSIQKLSNKLELTAQAITSENEKINSNIAIINQFKKESLDDINTSILTLNESVMELQADMTYLRERENHKEIVEEVIKKKGDDKGGVSSPLISKFIGALKHFTEGVGTMYKILFLLFVITLVILSITGVITWQDFKSILSFKFF